MNAFQEFRMMRDEAEEAGANEFQYRGNTYTRDVTANGLVVYRNADTEFRGAKKKRRRKRSKSGSKKSKSKSKSKSRRRSRSRRR